MSVAMQVVQIIFQSVAILFMICFMFIGIWSFIVFLKMSKNQRIQTYLLEKINKSISSLENTTNFNEINDIKSLMEDIITEDDNIINLDDNIK